MFNGDLTVYKSTRRNAGNRKLPIVSVGVCARESLEKDNNMNNKLKNKDGKYMLAKYI